MAPAVAFFVRRQQVWEGYCDIFEEYHLVTFFQFVFSLCMQLVKLVVVLVRVLYLCVHIKLSEPEWSHPAWNTGATR